MVIYAVVISVAACAAWCLFLHARRRRLLLPTTPARFGADIAARSLSVSAAFAASIAVAFVSPKAAQYVWIAAVPVRVVWLRWARRSAPSAARAPAAGKSDADPTPHVFRDDEADLGGGRHALGGVGAWAAGAPTVLLPPWLGAAENQVPPARPD